MAHEHTAAGFKLQRPVDAGRDHVHGGHDPGAVTVLAAARVGFEHRVGAASGRRHPVLTGLVRIRRQGPAAPVNEEVIAVGDVSGDDRH